MFSFLLGIYLTVDLLDYRVTLALQVAQWVKNLPTVQKTLVPSLGQEDPLVEGIATHSSILAWRIPMDREAWWATDHSVAKSWTWLSNWACTQVTLMFNLWGVAILPFRAAWKSFLLVCIPLISSSPWFSISSICWRLGNFRLQPRACPWVPDSYDPSLTHPSLNS